MCRAGMWEVWLKNCKVYPHQYLHQQQNDRRNTFKAVLHNVIKSIQIIMFYSFTLLVSRLFSRDAKQGQGKRASVKVRPDFTA